MAKVDKIYLVNRTNTVMSTELSAFGYAFLFVLTGIVFPAIGLLVAKIVRPNRPNEEKLTTYESGEDPVGTAWGQFNIRFYLVALIFVLFDVEIVFLFPWATVFGDAELHAQTNGLWSVYTFIEMGIFVFLLLLGLAYAWRKGFLTWVKPQAEVPEEKNSIPKEAYSNYLSTTKPTKKA